MTSKKSELNPASFLAGLDRRPLKLKQRLNLESVGMVLGRGNNPLEIAIASAAWKPSHLEAREAWEEIRDDRNVPLVLVILYNNRAMTCGPVGVFGPATGVPVVLADRDPRHLEHVCRVALDIVGGDLAARFLWHLLPEVKSK